MAPLLTLAGVFAHPDDETWSLAAVFALLVPKGVRGVVWTATRGQAGQIADGSGATRETLPRVREAEERAAMATVGVERVAFGDLMEAVESVALPKAELRTSWLYALTQGIHINAGLVAVEPSLV